MSLKARLKSYNPMEKQLARSFGWRSPNGVNFQFDAGGQPQAVSEQEAKILRTLRSVPDDPGSPLAFDVWDPDHEVAPALRPYLPSEKAQPGISSEAIRNAATEELRVMREELAAARAEREGAKATQDEMMKTLRELVEENKRLVAQVTKPGRPAKEPAPTPPTPPAP